MALLRSEIYLIGYPKDHLTGSKLPSKLDCLRVFFHHIKVAKLSIKESARLVIKECSVFWEKARIPVQKIINAEKKLLLLYNEWRTLSRHKARDSDGYKKKRESWKNSLNDLFDMAHVDALNLMKIEEDKQFLMRQRLKGREGCMLGIDINLQKKEEKQRQQQERLRKQQFEEAPSTSKGNCTLNKPVVLPMSY